MKKLQEYFLYFMFYSIIGWCYEVFLEVVVYRWGFSNRGVLFGPYCVIYGFGALILIFSLSWLMKKKIRVWKLNITPNPGFSGNCGDYYSSRVGGQLHHGSYKRGMDVGLHQICF